MGLKVPRNLSSREGRWPGERGGNEASSLTAPFLDSPRQHHIRRSTPNSMPECNPACETYERCITTISPCDNCPTAQCVSHASLEIPTAAQSSQGNGHGSSRVGLIAGLTTGLAVGAAIVVTVIGLVYFRKRRRQQIQKQKQGHHEIEKQDMDTSYFQPSPVGAPPPAVTLPMTIGNDAFLPAWSSSSSPPPPCCLTQHPPQPSPIPFTLQTLPESPAFMGTSALHIPRLQTPPSTATTPSSTTIRRSLSLLPSVAPPLSSLSRSSSVKVTKYDYQTDEDGTVVEGESAPVLRRAVSVRKNTMAGSLAGSEGGLARSASAGSTPLRRGDRLLMARPTMVQIVTTKMDNGVSRKASVRSTNNMAAPIGNSTLGLLAADNDSRVLSSSSSSNSGSSSSSSDSRLRTDSWGSQESGEITVIWNGHS
ncbi:hypothetical protein BX666DRAFT_1950340 [Dichotomocladium elegans]|nr:hypothetical protein BX666DRAFT_1950340 [Dichotomocladium elegans]